MKKVTLIRHAQSIFNSGEYYKDSDLLDCPLSNKGIEQAKEITGQFDLIICSTLKRAKQTLDNSSITANVTMYSDLFREQRQTSVLNFLEGEQIVDETPDDVRKRAREACNYIKTIPYTDIGIISHAHFIWYFLEQCAIQPFILQNGQNVILHI